MLRGCEAGVFTVKYANGRSSNLHSICTHQTVPTVSGVCSTCDWLYMQVQRVIKRQRSLANGEVAAAFAASPDHMQHPATPSVNFLGKCREVLHRVYHAIDSQGYILGLPARHVFYRPVSETFPSIAADYYRKIARPVTLREIEHRINTDSYSNALQFADVSVYQLQSHPKSCCGQRNRPTERSHRAVSLLTA